jgi:hypothetical protein
MDTPYEPSAWYDFFLMIGSAAAAFPSRLTDILGPLPFDPTQGTVMNGARQETR